MKKKSYIIPSMDVSPVGCVFALCEGSGAFTDPNAPEAPKRKDVF